MTEYHSPALESLINRAFNDQWSVDTGIDWSAPVVLPDGMDRADYIDMVSQLHHTEVLTIRLCARLIGEVPDFQAARFICTQIADESRHAQAYAAYVARLGALAPINEGLARTFEAGLAWRGSCYGLIVALNVMLEGEALQQQKRRIDTLPCPLFRQINARIMRDEARHAGFGLIYLRDRIPTLAASERAGIAAWVSGLWDRWLAANENRYASDGSALLRTDAGALRESRRRQMDLLRRIGLTAVVDG